jgi:hypothetical protein
LLALGCILSLLELMLTLLKPRLCVLGVELPPLFGIYSEVEVAPWNEDIRGWAIVDVFL